MNDPDIDRYIAEIRARREAAQPKPGPLRVIEGGKSGDSSKEALLVNDADPTDTAKRLGAILAKELEFLFNGNNPVAVTAEAGTQPRATDVTVEMVRVLGHEVCDPVKVNRKGETVSTPITRDVAQIYLRGLQGRWGLKYFRGITCSPILSPDGRIRTADGFDVASGLWCFKVPTVELEEFPTKEDAERALKALRHVFRTFPFADAERTFDAALGVEVVKPDSKPGLDESSYLAALLTAVCRQSLPLAPGFLCNAPGISGSRVGKGKLVRAACVIGSGASPEAFTSGHSEEEFDKRLVAGLTEASPCLFLDNFNAKHLRSDTLASALTEDPAKVRIMGQTKNVLLNTCCFIAITGNGVEVAEDMAGRIIITNFDAKMENPEERPFAPGFLEDIFARRTELLAHCLTIWRYGRQNTCPAGKPFGSFEVWAQQIRDLLLALGCRDPVTRIAEIKANDPLRKQLRHIFDTWWERHEDNFNKAADLHLDVQKLIDPEQHRQKIASFVQRHVGTRLGGYVLEETKDTSLKRPVTRYRLQRTTEDRHTEAGE